MSATQSMQKTFSFMDNEEVALYLMAIMRPEDVVLIKGSHGMKMDEIVKILRINYANYTKQPYKLPNFIKFGSFVCLK